MSLVFCYLLAAYLLLLIFLLLTHCLSSSPTCCLSFVTYRLSLTCFVTRLLLILCYLSLLLTTRCLPLLLASRYVPLLTVAYISLRIFCHLLVIFRYLLISVTYSSPNFCLLACPRYLLFVTYLSLLLIFCYLSLLITHCLLLLISVAYFLLLTCCSSSATYLLSFAAYSLLIFATYLSPVTPCYLLTFVAHLSLLNLCYLLSVTSLTLMPIFRHSSSHLLLLTYFNI